MRVVDGSSPTVPTAGVTVLIMVWVGDNFVTGFVMLASQKFLQSEDTSDQEGNLGEEYSLGSGESDDAEEQGNESGDLQLGEGQKGHQLLDLLLLATGWKEIKTTVSNGTQSTSLCGTRFGSPACTIIFI